LYENTPFTCCVAKLYIPKLQTWRLCQSELISENMNDTERCVFLREIIHSNTKITAIIIIIIIITYFGQSVHEVHK